ncbi:hypothetical protein [Curvibacter sp. PAE-UM]|uniref:hypothetical protein n=1 Tax=Curvibacter sp. PAE-UM TaxID=1714344 RepID=UPI0012E3BD0D|nr:hypothetical protein [Curvibacter sp. PAE-UM]
MFFSEMTVLAVGFFIAMALSVYCGLGMTRIGAIGALLLAVPCAIFLGAVAIFFAVSIVVLCSSLGICTVTKSPDPTGFMYALPVVYSPVLWGVAIVARLMAGKKER